MITSKAIRTKLSGRLSRLVAMLVASAWMFTVQACLLGDEAAAATPLPTSYVHPADDTALGHQDVDHCGLVWGRVSAAVQSVAMAPVIKAAAMPPAPVAAIPAPMRAGPAGTLAAVSALADTRPRGHDRDFATFWSHAPPANRA